MTGVPGGTTSPISAWRPRTTPLTGAINTRSDRVACAPASAARAVSTSARAPAMRSGRVPCRSRRSVSRSASRRFAVVEAFVRAASSCCSASAPLSVSAWIRSRSLAARSASASAARRSASARSISALRGPAQRPQGRLRRRHARPRLFNVRGKRRHREDGHRVTRRPPRLVGEQPYNPRGGHRGDVVLTNLDRPTASMASPSSREHPAASVVRRTKKDATVVRTRIRVTVPGAQAPPMRTRRRAGHSLGCAPPSGPLGRRRGRRRPRGAR